jgi:CBS domain-containing protein
MPAGSFLMLVHGNAAIREYYCRRLARRLDEIVGVHERREAAAALMAPIGASELHPPVFVPPDTSLEDATAIMRAENTSALLVRRTTGGPGVFTQGDLHEKLNLLRLPPATPVGDLASHDLVSLRPDDTLFDALRVMTRHAIRHVIVGRGADIEGLFEQRDLLRSLAGRANVIAAHVNDSASPDDLKEAGAAITELIRGFLERGVKTRYIARLVTRLNREILARVYEGLAPKAVRESSCLIAMGSEGRGEQLVKTDQDNGLILGPGLDWEQVAPITRAFVEALADLGYPPCEGDVMVSNPDWTQSVDAYKKTLRRWIYQPDDISFNQLAVFLDASPIAGDAGLLDTLKAHVFELLDDQTVVLGHIAKPMLGFGTPLGLFNRLITEKQGPNAGKLDIKKGGVFPIVHGVRCLALEQRMTETSTLDRIHVLSSLGVFTRGLSADLIESLDIMSSLRVRAQLEQMARGGPCDNYINPRDLANRDRDLLRASLKIVKEFKKFILYHFKLNLVG